MKNMLVINTNMHLSINGTTSFFINMTKEFLEQKQKVICIINKKNTKLFDMLKNISGDIAIKTVSNNGLLAFFQYFYIYLLLVGKKKFTVIHDINRVYLFVAKIFCCRSYISLFGECVKKLYKCKLWLYGALPAKQYHYNILKQDYPKLKTLYFPYTVQFNKSLIDKRKQSRFTFGCLGALVELKGFKQVIMASNQLKQFGYDFQVLIGGDGEQKQQLIQLINEYKLDDYVKLLGRVEDKYIFFNKLDVFLFSSNKEDIGMVLPEAISYKVPIISNRIAFCSDLLTEEEYLMAEADDLKNVEKIWPAKDKDKIWWQVKTNYRFETEKLDPKLLCEKMKFSIDNYSIMIQKAKKAYNKVEQYSMENMIKKLLNESCNH